MGFIVGIFITKFLHRHLLLSVQNYFQNKEHSYLGVADRHGFLAQTISLLASTSDNDLIYQF